MASYTDITNILNFAVAFNPSSAFPLDARSMVGSYEQAVTIAASAAEPGGSTSKYYIGQTLTVYENDTVTDYKIQPDKTLKAIGSNLVGDDKSVVLSGDTLSLKSFGEKYFKYISIDTILEDDSYEYPDNMPEGVDGAYIQLSDTWYLYSEDAWAATETTPVTTAYYSLTEGWTDGLEPKVIKNTDSTYEIAWYEPSTTTVEGLQSALASVQTEVDTVDDRLTELNNAQSDALAAEVTRATTAESALSTSITTNTSAITLLNSSSTTEGSVSYQIAQAVAAIMENPDETINSISELVDWISNHAEDALALSNSVTANTTAVAALETLVGTLPDDITATTVIGYITEAVAAEATRATAAEVALGGRIDTVIAGLGTAAAAAATDFATAAQGALADSAVQSVVASETNGNVTVDGDEVTVYTLPTASTTTVGGVKVDGTSIGVTEGVASVVAVDSSKVTGLTSAISSGAQTYVEANAVLTSNIAGSETIATSVTDASDSKVVSEKVILDALTWKTEM